MKPLVLPARYWLWGVTLGHRRVAPWSGTSTDPAGSVTFKDGTRPLSTKTLNSSGQATFSTSSLGRGSHSITVVYGGSSSFLGSTFTRAYTAGELRKSGPGPLGP